MKTCHYLIGWLALIVLSVSACKEDKPARPNILFILADDWSYPYAGMYGDHTIKTPNLDRLAQHGTVFTNAYCASPSCTPSRAAMLTGRYPHNLGEGVNLCGRLDYSVPTYVQLLKKEGYAVAFDRKGWAPGDFLKMGYRQNPAGDSAKLGFGPFLDQLPKDQPFFFWFGTNDPHRPFDLGNGKKAGIDPQKIHLPKFLPDVPEVRGDVADYLSEVERLDLEIGDLLKKLETSGKLANTIIVVASDNGMPFPHAKANLYDYGTRVPLLISRFSDNETQPKRNDSFVNLIDLMPTFLDWVGVKERPKVDGKSLVPVLTGQTTTHRSEVFLERERHCLCRAEMDSGAGYPMRAIRTADYLYIRNFRPNRMPAGDENIPNTPSVFGDVDGGPTKVYMMDHRNDAAVKSLFALGFARRPAEELYVLKGDPYNLNNRANDAQLASVKKDLQERLERWMNDEHDPRLNGGGDQIDRYESTTHAWITRTGIIFWDK
ncbi:MULTISPECIES: sulfatase [unclassified Spirosoma]|uniref:sulfatase family protein n=1 Tax=unclassified Spirosoma TaxID=2621999 RepID=UPI0009692154|nr:MULTISPECIES: sulfatase [unclassified Spirosoma]MBN8821704.1 sulfatase [Spirosoma sp.]OJW80799.1 MAG: N-sulfoglucosamine sulfohydrolase [Spirosoma sp. 48-14]